MYPPHHIHPHTLYIMSSPNTDDIHDEESDINKTFIQTYYADECAFVKYMHDEKDPLFEMEVAAEEIELGTSFSKKLDVAMLNYKLDVCIKQDENGITVTESSLSLSDLLHIMQVMNCASLKDVYELVN